jgi:hypothetical protein
MQENIAWGSRPPLRTLYSEEMWPTDRPPIGS